MFGEVERRMMRLGNWLIALICGSMGVFSLWFSYHGVALMPYVVGFFAIAFGLEAANHYFLGAERPVSRR